MKSAKKISFILVTLLLIFMCSLQVTFGADGEGYKYKVTVSSGETSIGEIQDGDITEEVAPGETFAFDLDKVKINDSRYYAKGIKKSGRDNYDSVNTYYANRSPEIDKDSDFVVAYGLKATMVKYVVKYVDEDGNELLKSQVCYGNVGDTPVVAHHYIEGMQPQAYNLTKTLQSDESLNVLSFVYRVQPAGAVVPGAGGANGAAGAGAGAGGAAGANGAAAAADGNAANDGTIQNNDQVPRDIINLDDEDVPLANKSLGGSTSKLPMIIGGIVAVGGVGLLAALIAAFIRRRRDAEDYDEMDYELQEEF